MHGYGVKTKRFAAGFMAVIMLAVLVCASLFIALESVHECEGAECGVCAVIGQCENIINQSGSGETHKVSLPVPAFVVVSLFIVTCVDLVKTTPVSEKIRLNN